MNYYISLLLKHKSTQYSFIKLNNLKHTYKHSSQSPNQTEETHHIFQYN
jgi:hypothetical protein